MNLGLETWYRATTKGKIELAEETEAWNVQIDQGKLRTRTLDRYFKLSKLPKKPRIRAVYQTIRHILDAPELNDSQVKELENLLKKVQKTESDFLSLTQKNHSSVD